MSGTINSLSEIAIANMAATTLDDTHLSSLNEDHPLATFLKAEYSFARDELLQAHKWVFAKARAKCPEVDLGVDDFGWQHKYAIPADYLSLVYCNQGGYHNGQPVAMEREGQFIYSNACAPLYLVYIRRVTNPTEMTPLFARCLGQYLAVMAAQRVTGKNSYLEKAQRLFNQSMATAVQANTLDYGTPETQYRSNVIDVRLAG